MIEIAGRRAARLGLQNVSFREADAESLPFPDESFDVVISTMGLIHTADRNKALQEMFRVARKNGVLALSVWSTPERTVGLAIMAKTIREAWPAAVVPGAPTWFDFGADGVLEAFLAKTGFVGIAVERVPAVMELQSADAYWERCLGISGKLRMLLGTIPPDVARAIEVRAKAAAEGFRVGATIRIPNEEIVARAQKP
jgi:SAM-dependent methyltransferase